MKTDPSSPAFARATDNPNLKGLTKREYFAAAALTGLLAHEKGSPLTAPHDAADVADELIKILNVGNER